MAAIHGKATLFNQDASDLTAYFNDIQVSQKIAADETTTFGAAEGAKTFLQGLKDGTIALTGLFDGVTGAIDTILSATILSASDNICTVGVGSSAVGSKARLWQSTAVTYEVHAPVGGVVATKYDAQADGGVDNGRILAGLISISTTSFQVGVDHGVLTSNGGVGHLHVPINTRNGTAVIKVQHSVDNSTWADLITFSTVGTSTTTQERIIVATGTTVNRYLRASYTPAGTTGALTITVAFARR
jgi:hypothetical protein